MMSLDGITVATGDLSGLAGNTWSGSHQTTIWWNAYKNRWDGVIPTSVAAGAAAASHWWITKDVTGTPSAHLLLHTTTGRFNDCWWDNAAKKLYVLGVGATNAQFFRFSYDDSTDAYTKIGSTLTLPTPLGGTGKKDVIGKTPNGYLWVGTTGSTNNRFDIARSTDDGVTWSTVKTIKTLDYRGDINWAGFNDGSTNRAAFAMTEDGSVDLTSAQVHFLHIDEANAGYATPGNWTDETSSIPAHTGTERADDELQAIVYQNNVYITIETEAGSAGNPQLVVYKRTQAGVWTKHTVNTVASGLGTWKRPNICIVTDTGQLVVVAGRPTTTNEVAYFKASLTNLNSWVGPVLLAQTGASISIYDPRTPRDPVSAGFPVLFSDETNALVKRASVNLPNVDVNYSSASEQSFAGGFQANVALNDSFGFSSEGSAGFYFIATVGHNDLFEYVVEGSAAFPFNASVPVVPPLVAGPRQLFLGRNNRYWWIRKDG